MESSNRERMVVCTGNQSHGGISASETCDLFAIQEPLSTACSVALIGAHLTCSVHQYLSLDAVVSWVLHRTSTLPPNDFPVSCYSLQPSEYPAFVDDYVCYNLGIIGGATTVTAPIRYGYWNVRQPLYLWFPFKEEYVVRGTSNYLTFTVTTPFNWENTIQIMMSFMVGVTFDP